jgi:hypothetical protein
MQSGGDERARGTHHGRQVDGYRSGRGAAVCLTAVRWAAAVELAVTAPRATLSSRRMSNDHFIPQFLTSPWEYRDRKLRVFDFVTRDFSDVPAKRLFARIGINSPRLETWFNQTIETPVARFANALRQGQPLEAPKDWSVVRGLALLFFFLSTARITEAVGTAEAAPTSLEELSKDETFVDHAAHYFLQRFKLACVRMSGASQMFFTEAVRFAYPMPESPVAAIPLGLNHAVLAYDGPLTVEKLLENVNLPVLSNFSMGVGLNVHRIILPPGWRESSISDPDAARLGLLEVRQSLQDIFNLVGKASELVGLRGWEVTR